MTAPTWNENFKLTDGLYLLHDIPNYFQYINGMHEAALFQICQSM